MKKKLIAIILMIMLVLPIGVYAKDKQYKTMNFKETLKDESIEIENKSYSENKNQVTIYMFRGKGCGYCRAFLTFLNSISEEYGKYFKLVSYEVWNDKTNNDLLAKVSAFLGQSAGGVPYIIIGDKVFPGYASSYDEEIKNAITTLYKTNKSDRYDVMKEYEKSLNPSTGVSSTKVIIWNLVFAVIATSIIIVFINIKFNKLDSKINSIAKKANKTEKK